MNMGWRCGTVLVVLRLRFKATSFLTLPPRKSTGSVNTEDIFTRGRYMLGPDKRFVKYQADAHFVEIE